MNYRWIAGLAGLAGTLGSATSCHGQIIPLSRLSFVSAAWQRGSDVRGTSEMVDFNDSVGFALGGSATQISTIRAASVAFGGTANGGSGGGFPSLGRSLMTFSFRVAEDCTYSLTGSLTSPTMGSWRVAMSRMDIPETLFVQTSSGPFDVRGGLPIGTYQLECIADAPSPGVVSWTGASLGVTVPNPCPTIIIAANGLIMMCRRHRLPL